VDEQIKHLEDVRPANIRAALDVAIAKGPALKADEACCPARATDPLYREGRGRFDRTVQ
jgi:hypothetical protein